MGDGCIRHCKSKRLFSLVFFFCPSRIAFGTISLPIVLRDLCYTKESMLPLLSFSCLSFFIKSVSNTSVVSSPTSRVDTHLCKLRGTPVARFYRRLSF